MTKLRTCLALAGILGLLAGMAMPGLAQIGPDVIVGSLTGPGNYGSIGNVAAFSLGTNSCNMGDQPLNWYGGTNQHPVIGQNLYRIKDGRFEQVGLSWLKHGFTALQQSLCTPCTPSGTGNLLGVGCSDPYSSGLNGSQSNLGPRFEVDASLGYFPFPFTSPPYSGNDRRLLVHHDDLNPALNAGAIYLAEGQYISPDDALAGNNDNNASWRRVNVNPSSGSYTLSYNGGTIREKAAIEGWKVFDPSIVLTNVDFPNDGRFIVAEKVNPAGAGMNQYVFAIHNLNSDRSGGSFTVDLPSGANVQNTGFHDINYHSGEPWDGTDWNVNVASNGVMWSTTPFSIDPNANALRWGTTYTFWFESDQAPTGFTITPFKPGQCPPGLPWSNSGYQLNPSAPYDYVDISAAGPQQGPVLDDSAVTANIGFNFDLFGTTINTIKISSNGYLCLVSENGTIPVNGNIPNPGQPNGTIAGLWDDLNPAAGGNITYATVGTAPHRRVVVDDFDVPHWGAISQKESLQIILDEGTNRVSSTIVSSVQKGSSATRGIENATGTAGVLASMNLFGSALPGTTLTYTPDLTVPQSALLELIGDGSPNTTFGWHLVSGPNRPLILAMDTDPGPLNMGALGMLDLGFSSGFYVLCDGTGLFTPLLDPNAVTDNDCGVYDLAFSTGPGGIPPLGVHFQAVIMDVLAPNGVFHISTSVTH